MTTANTATHYGSVAKSFHWLTALLIFTVIPLGIIANGIAHRIEDPAIAVTDAEIARAAFLFSLHKTLGLVIFVVALARIAWALRGPKPGLLNADKPLEATLAETVHWLLYGSLLLVPLTGWIHHAATTGFAPIWWPFGQSLPFVPKSPEVAELFAGLHMVLERVLVISILLHVAGALKHHVIDKDATLRRMLPGRVSLPALPDGAHRPLMPVMLAVLAWGAAISTGAALGIYAPHHAEIAEAATLEEVSSDWEVQEGTIDISVRQFGNAVTGSFADWTAAIQFEPRDTPGPSGRADVTIAIGSLTLGSVTAQAMGADYFDAAQFPTAEFGADLTRGETGYVATGTLTLRGAEVPVTLPFDLTLDGDTAQMSGQLTLNRLDFGIGATQQDENTLGFDVDVRVTLTASRATPSDS